MNRCIISLIITGTQVKTIVRHHLSSIRRATIKKSTNNKCWRGYGEKGTIIHCWWEFSSVRFSSVAQSCPTLATPWTAALQASLSFTNSRSLLNLMPIASVMPSNYLIPCCPLFLLPSIFPSIRVFTNESVLCIRWPKYWSFSFSISPSNEYSGLISFRMDWLDVLAVQGTLESLLQHHSSKASILYSPTLTSIHDYWKNHSLDYMDLYWQSNVSAF